MSPPAGLRRDGEAWKRVEHEVALIIADARLRIDRSDEGLSSTDVHAVRVACKRLRALWRMLEPALGASTTRPAERALRDAAKELAGQRQAAVLVQTLLRLGRKATKRKDRRLAAELAERLTLALGGPAAGSTPGPLMRTVFEEQSWALAALPRSPSAEDLLLGILHGALRARKSGRRAKRAGEAVLWHRCRRWVKYEHYQLGLALRPKGALRHRQRRLERLGTLLGQHQDGFDLEQQLAGSDAALRLPESAARVLDVWRCAGDTDRLLTCVRRAQQRLLKRIEGRFDILYGGRRGDLEAALREAFARS